MGKKGVITMTVALIALVLLFVFAKIARDAVGVGFEGLYKIGSCYRNDEFGVTYKVKSTAKGQSFAEVVASEKYPSQEEYKIGAQTHWSSKEPLGPMHEEPCPGSAEGTPAGH